MKKFLAFVLLIFLRFCFWFRYKVTIKGLDKINPHVLNKPGGRSFPSESSYSFCRSGISFLSHLDKVSRSARHCG